MVSTMTESPGAAAGAALGFGVVAEILDAITSLGSVRDFLPFKHFEDWHDWFVFGHAPPELWKSLGLPLLYNVVFCAIAWWRFKRKDITV
jgi:ABC-2 type transport system permease protein